VELLGHGEEAANLIEGVHDAFRDSSNAVRGLDRHRTGFLCSTSDAERPAVHEAHGVHDLPEVSRSP
jgi:hypothetical protein